jgi:hypothetical protein
MAILDGVARSSRYVKRLVPANRHHWATLV